MVCLFRKTHLFLFLYSRFQKLYQMQPGHSGNCVPTYLAVRRDIMIITSGRIRRYVGT